jgi:hypothetical protein
MRANTLLCRASVTVGRAADEKVAFLGRPCGKRVSVDRRAAEIAMLQLSHEE